MVTRLPTLAVVLLLALAPPARADRAEAGQRANVPNVLTDAWCAPDPGPVTRESRWTISPSDAELLARQTDQLGRMACKMHKEPDRVTSPHSDTWQGAAVRALILAQDAGRLYLRARYFGFNSDLRPTGADLF